MFSLQPIVIKVSVIIYCYIRRIGIIMYIAFVDDDSYDSYQVIYIFLII